MERVSHERCALLTTTAMMGCECGRPKSEVSSVSKIKTCVFPLLVAAVSVATANGQQSQPTEPPDRRNPLADARMQVYKSIDDVDLALYMFMPKDHHPDDTRAAIVFFFGGGWRGGSPKQFAEHCRYFASRGMVAMTADYRVFSRHRAQVKDCVSDARSALRWIRGHAGDLGIDPNRIVASGGSAGGHLAATLGTLEEFDESGEDLSIRVRPDALVLFNPALDLTAEGFGVDRENDRIAALHERLGAEPEALSPLHHVSRTVPPTILFHGTADTTVPFAQAEHFCEAIQDRGGRCELADYEEAGHGFFNFGRGGNRAYVDTVRRADVFLAALGFLEGDPTIGAMD